jgi:hypothetical protein
MNNLDIIKNLYSKYINNPSYVYKKCTDDRDDKNEIDNERLLILRKLSDIPDKKTDKIGYHYFNNYIKPCIKFKKEFYPTINEQYSKHYATQKLELVLIIDVNDPHRTENSIIKRDNNSSVEYSNSSIIDLYDLTLQNYCQQYLHYYLTVDAAYFSGSIPEKHNGYTCFWSDNGEKYEDGEIQNGEKIIDTWKSYPVTEPIFWKK